MKDPNSTGKHDAAVKENTARTAASREYTGRSPVRTLSHSMASGYGAQLYSYKWADVMVADAFSRFTGQGGIDTSAGAAFRECILSKGDSKPAAQLFRDFMGREPRPAAWLRSLGVRTEPAE